MFSLLGFNVFSGSVVKVLNKAVAFIASSGFGKSTLSQLFIKNHYSILTEEICVVDRNYEVLPSYPEICLWGNIAHQLEVDTSCAGKVRSNLDKFSIRVDDSFYAKPLPLEIVYIVDYHKKNEILFTLISLSEFWNMQREWLGNPPIYNRS